MEEDSSERKSIIQLDVKETFKNECMLVKKLLKSYKKTKL